MRYAYACAIAAILYSTSALGWKVALQPDTANHVKQIVVTNAHHLHNVDAYLVLFDKDGQSPNEMFISWTLDRGWQKGLMPVSTTPLELPPFEAKTIASLENSCPENHRCFLAMVAVATGSDPLTSEWQAASLLPLNSASARERLAGQEFFLPSGTDNRATLGGDGTAVDDAAAKPPLVPSADKANTTEETDGNATTTEKPDIFKLDGSELLYANGQAQRFQVIDVANPQQPRLTASTNLAGSPRELYTIGNYHILLQTDYDPNQKVGTRLTVLHKESTGQLTTVQELTLQGTFLESRRRGDFIYAVTQSASEVFITDQPIAVDDTVAKPACVDCGGTPAKVTIEALRLNAQGQLEKVAEKQVLGYSPVVAIFPDHLVVANPDPQQWPATQVQVFDLSNPTVPLTALPLLQVAGRIPSEFHLSIQNQQLRVVYGPADIADGSTLAIYDLTTAKPSLLGQVGKIAPKEDLFATRFNDNLAFVVTYERKDPLWVIDLTDPTAPKIKGELEVPGWSEKLFFHNNRLFGVGIHDQADQPDTWVRQVAVSLFDVTDSMQPTILDRFVPLAKQANYSWSPALDDERALLLNWNDSFAALPIESWETTEAGSYLQIISFANDKFKDEGLVNSPIQLQRSLPISSNTLAALGDQALLTIGWGNGQATVLAELELAINLSWLQYQGNNLWGASLGSRGYHRLYRYAPPAIAEYAQHWQLPRGYQGVKLDEKLAIFYNVNPLAVQVVELESGNLRQPQILETVTTGGEIPPSATPIRAEGEGGAAGSEGSGTSDSSEGKEPDIAAIAPIWYDRRTPLVHDGWFYVPEQQPLPGEMRENLAIPEGYWQPQWTLRSWNLTTDNAKEAPARSIPGEPVAFTAKGKLITQEWTETGKLRLNLLALEPAKANLVHSQEMPCDNYSAQVMATKEALYVTCVHEINYLVPPKDTDPRENTVLFKLDPEQGFNEVGQWSLVGRRNLQAVSSDVIMVSMGWGWYGGAYPLLEGDATVKVAADMSIMPPYYQSGCDVYRLASEPLLLKHLDNCPMFEGVALTNEQAWIANGFAGIEAIQW